jgi:predicted methyltransferase
MRERRKNPLSELVEVSFSSPAKLADWLAPRRPANDPSLEQFLMQSGSLADQGALIGERFDGRSVLFLGDDDHASIIAAAFGDIAATVYELDERVAESLRSWARELRLRNYAVEVADIRSVSPTGERCDAFYINPPFSSKNDGHGLRYWITKALELCVSHCEGIVVMPADDDLDWVNRNWISVQQFVSENGCRILSTGESQLHTYESTNDVGLRSQNLFLRRIDPSRERKELIRHGTSLYR